jgi:hypothetical protein
MADRAARRLREAFIRQEEAWHLEEARHREEYTLAREAEL